MKGQMLLVNDCDFIDLIPWADEGPDVTIQFPSGTFGYRSQHIKQDMEAKSNLSLLIPPSATSSITPTGRVIGYITGIELTNVIHSETEQYYKLYGYSQFLEVNSAKRLITPGSYKAIPLFPKILGNDDYVEGLVMVYYIIGINEDLKSMISYYNQLRTGCDDNHPLEYLEKHHPYPKTEVDRYHQDNGDVNNDLRDLFTSIIYYRSSKLNIPIETDFEAAYQRFLASKEYRNSLRPYLPSVEYTAAVKLVLRYLQYGTIGLIGDQIVFGSRLTWQLYDVKLDVEYTYPDLNLIDRLANDIDLLNEYMVCTFDLDRPIDEILLGYYLTLKSLDNDTHFYVDHYQDITQLTVGTTNNRRLIKVTNITKVSLLGWVKLYYNLPMIHDQVNRMVEIGNRVGNQLIEDLYYYNYLGYGINIKDGRFCGVTNDGYIPLPLDYDWYQAAIDFVDN